jgi:hypothetical protein
MSKKKQKTKVFSFQGFDNKHYQTTEQYAVAVDVLFNRATDEIATIAAKGAYNPDKPFTFDDYPQTKNQVQNIITGLASKMTSVIENGSRKQWLFACKKNDEFVASIMDTSKLSKKRLDKMQDRNLDALKTFQDRKIDGLNLSQRVWKYVDQYKVQIEQGLDVGLGDGVSAQRLSKDLRQNLKDPNRLFRRVRDKRGNLQLSKAAKAFHPGQGVYRSSVKNAERLTRSEINMAYREADWMRWQQLDFVVGFEVHRSNREPRFKCPLCDKLTGRYPKQFKFKGWHPQCMCYATAILMDEETFDEQELSDLKAALKGTEYKKLEAKNAVTDMPQGFKDWVAENQQKQSNWGSTPYFIKDNFNGGKMLQGLKFDTSAMKPKPELDPKAQEMALLQTEISAIEKDASNWALSTFIIEFAVKTGEPSKVRTAIAEIKKRIEETKRGRDTLISDLMATISEAKKYKIDTNELESSLGTLQGDTRTYMAYGDSIKKKVQSVKEAIFNAVNPKSDYSMKMPDELKAGSKYLHGEEYVFDKQFFDLIDSNKSVNLSVSTSNKGAYYSPLENKVYLFDASRNANSKWHAKAAVYHEFGHAIDWQRDLRKSKEVSELRSGQIKLLKKQSTYKVWERSYNYSTGKYETNKVERKMSLVAYIDRKLQELTLRIWKMQNETFIKRGITKMDVIEQIGSVRDTIKSLVISYGDGHSTSYFKRYGMQQAEYLAHAFENAFIGNEVFKKYMPDIYNEMISYIRSLK